MARTRGVIATLRNNELFAYLTEEQLRQLEHHAFQLSLRDGQWLFRQGERVNRFYLVSSGRLGLLRLSPDGSEKVIEIVTPGNCCGGGLLFTEEPRYAVCALALEQAEVISLDTAVLLRLLQASVATYFQLMTTMSRHISHLVEEIEQIALHTATSRFACYLLSKVPVTGQVLTLDLRKGIIASLLTIKPETFSRLIKDLTERGIIVVSGPQVRILDRTAMEQLAGIRPCQEDNPPSWAGYHKP